jgi:hypothetical protein
MSNSKYSWLKKNPIVLLFRRLYRRFFKPKQNFVRFNPEYPLINVDQNNVESLPILEVETEEYDDGLATIGQLFEQVNWHNRLTIDPEKSLKDKKVARIISISSDPGSFATVGGLFQQVKWRVPPKVIQEQFLNTTKSPQAYDVSLN